ncbi:MAG: CoA transferase [Clostridia bacterium]|nr:CoA transferase [Clostridia bacterium]
MSNKLPLQGIRITDFSWVGAGPTTTRTLAEYGAEVIKIESSKRPEILRLTGPFRDAIPGVNRSGYFSNRNPNKKSLDLNMKHPKARDLVVDLIKKSDIIINNFTLGVMEKWDLGYEDVKKINPQIIYVTMPSQGSTGPHADYMGFGGTMSALVGINYLSGFPEGEPFGTGTNYPDHVPNPAHTAFGIMAALWYRKKTGEGQYLEIAQTETSLNFLPTAVMNYSLNDEILERIGNRNLNAAPHGVYTTLGNSRWIAIAAFTEQEWTGIKQVMGFPAWADADKFATLDHRLKNQDELDASIEEWTKGHDGYQLMNKLVQAGVRAGVVQNPKDLLEDPNLIARNFYKYLDHPEMRRHVYNITPCHLSKTPGQLTSPAPLIGEHTDEVLREVLGLSEKEIQVLKAQDVVG